MEVKEPAVAYGNRKFTIEEYLEMERSSEIFRVNESGYWQLEEYKKEDEFLHIHTIGFQLPLQELYHGTKLM